MCSSIHRLFIVAKWLRLQDLADWVALGAWFCCFGVASPKFNETIGRFRQAQQGTLLLAYSTGATQGWRKRVVVQSFCPA